MSFAERRARALAGFAGGVAVIPAAHEMTRSNDTAFPFRQNSDFFYLTGFAEPDAVLVLAPEHPEHRVALFLRPRDRTAEIWNGRRLGIEAASATLGVDVAYDIAQLDERLAEYLVGATTLHAKLGADERFDRRMHAALDTARAKTRRKGCAPERIANPSIVLHELRLYKSADEIEALRRAAAISRDGHLAAMRFARPGRYEYELQAELEHAFRRSGANGAAYESIVASGENATILHYVSNGDCIRDGDLVLIDAGCEFDGYAGDVTRTFPANGRFSGEQRALYEIVLAAMEAAFACVRPGIPRTAFHDAAVRRVTEGLIDIGLLRGDVDENIENDRYRDFFMHGTGHWLGLDVHDAGRYRNADDSPIAFAPGMVTTVEPGIYVGRDLDCDERFKGIGIRIEDDLLITPSGHENLNAAIPKTIAEIETLLAERA